MKCLNLIILIFIVCVKGYCMIEDDITVSITEDVLKINLTVHNTSDKEIVLLNIDNPLIEIENDYLNILYKVNFVGLKYFDYYGRETPHYYSIKRILPDEKYTIDNIFEIPLIQNDIFSKSLIKSLKMNTFRKFKVECGYSNDYEVLLYLNSNNQKITGKEVVAVRDEKKVIAYEKVGDISLYELKDMVTIKRTEKIFDYILIP